MISAMMKNLWIRADRQRDDKYLKTNEQTLYFNWTSSVVKSVWKDKVDDIEEKLGSRTGPKMSKAYNRSFEKTFVKPSINIY